MRILFADKFPQEQLVQLRDRGHTCVYAPTLVAEELAKAIGDSNALVVRSTRVEQGAIAAGRQLQLIIRAGAGTNTIDKQFAANQSIPVCNVPGKNAIAVAELTMGLLIAIDRNIPDNVSDLRANVWNKKKYSESRGIFGRSIGIVGVGAIGTAVAERAHAFGMRVYMINKKGRSQELLSRLEALDVTWVDSLEELAEICDVVTFHVPVADSTKHRCGADFLGRLRDGAIVLNTSRGDVVDERALLKALDEKSIRAGLDVYQNEPNAAQGEFVSPLVSHPNVYGTHHIGASTAQAQKAVADGVVEIFAAFENGKIINRVN